MTPVGMLEPGNGKTHKANIWTYCTTTFNSTKAVVFNFAETRSGENVREFLGQNGEQDTRRCFASGFLSPTYRERATRKPRSSMENVGWLRRRLVARQPRSRSDHPPPRKIRYEP